MCGMAVFTFDGSGWWRVFFYLYLFSIRFMGWHFCCLRLFLLPYFLKPYSFFPFCFHLCSFFHRLRNFLTLFLLISLYLCCTYLGRADMIPGGFILFFFSLLCFLFAGWLSGGVFCFLNRALENEGRSVGWERMGGYELTSHCTYAHCMLLTP
jgi:hypothetical protein